MPLTIEEANRSLDILWDVKKVALAEGKDTAPINRAISILSTYVKDIQPSFQVSVWDHFQSGVAEGLKHLSSPHFGPLRTVELLCSASEKLGLYLDTVSKYSNSIHSSHGYPPVVISHITSQGTAERSGELKIGDQVLDINGHVLAHVSLQKARWLLESAYRSGKVTLVVVTSGLARRLRKSQILTKSSPGGKDDKVVPPAKQPRFTPAVGTKGSCDVLLETILDQTTTVGEKGPQFKKRKVVKIHVMKEESGLGVQLFGGKGSKYGDIGIFIRGITKDSWIHKDGRLKEGDEILVVNRKSLIGLSLQDALTVIAKATNPLQLVIATEKTDDPSRDSFVRSSVLSYSYFDKSRPSSQVRTSPNVPQTETKPLGVPQTGTKPSGVPQTGTKPSGVPQTGTKPSGVPKTGTKSSSVPRTGTKFRKNKIQHIQKNTATISPVWTTPQPRPSPHLPANDSTDHLDEPQPHVITDTSILTIEGEMPSLSENEALFTTVKEKPTAEKTVHTGTRKKSKLMAFFKRERKSRQEELPPRQVNTFPSKRRTDCLIDEISVGEELYPLDLAMGPGFRDPEERDRIGDLEVSKASKPRKTSMPPSTTGCSSIQSTLSDDVEVVKNWAKLSSSNLHEGNTLNQPVGVIKTVLLYKPPKSQPKPLGFTLHGGAGSHYGEVGVHIKSIAPDSLAAADERLKEGDEMLEVNGHLVDGMTHKKVAQLIKSEYARYGMISLKVCVSSGPNPSLKRVRSPSVKGTPFIVKLHKDSGCGLGIEFTGVTFDTNRFGIYIQKIIPGSPAENANSFQRGDQILEINQRKLAGVKLEEVRSIFGRLPAGEVVIKLMRPSNVAAIERLLDNIASARRKSMEGSFSVEVFGQKELTPVKSPVLVPRPENAPTVDQEILDLFENEMEEELMDGEEYPKKKLASPLKKYKLDTSRHSTVDDSDSSSEEELEPVRDKPIEPVPEEDPCSTDNISALPDRPATRQKKPFKGRPPSASFTAFDANALVTGGDLVDMQARFPSTGSPNKTRSLLGLSRNLSMGSGSSAKSFITEMVTITKGADGFGMTVLGGKAAPLQGALVTAVDTGSPAHLEGRMEKGDEILEVNGQSIIGMTHAQVIGILRKVKDKLVMKIARSSPEVTSMTSLTRLDRDSPVDSSGQIQHFQPPLIDGGSGRLHTPPLDESGCLHTPPLDGSGRLHTPPLDGSGHLHTPPLDGSGHCHTPPLDGSGHLHTPPLDGSGRLHTPPLSGGSGHNHPQSLDEERGHTGQQESEENEQNGKNEGAGVTFPKPPPAAITRLRDELSRVSSVDSLVESTDDELENQPSIVRQITLHSNNTLDGRRFGSLSQYKDKETDLAYVVSSSSDPSLDESSQPECVMESSRLELNKTPTKDPKASLPISKASSGVSIVFSYSVDWQEDGNGLPLQNIPQVVTELEENSLNTPEQSREKDVDFRFGGSRDSNLRDSPLVDSRRRVNQDDTGNFEGEVPPGYEKIAISIQKKSQSGLGITVVSSSGVTSGYHQIRRILPRSLADRDGQLKPGDRLVSVNGKSLKNLSHSSVLDELKMASHNCTIEILRDPLYNVDATSSIYSVGSGSYYDSRLSMLSDDGTEMGTGREKGSPLGTPTGSLKKAYTVGPGNSVLNRKSAGAELLDPKWRHSPDPKRFSLPDSQRVYSVHRQPVGISPLLMDSTNPPAPSVPPPDSNTMDTPILDTPPRGPPPSPPPTLDIPPGEYPPGPPLTLDTPPGEPPSGPPLTLDTPPGEPPPGPPPMTAEDKFEEVHLKGEFPKDDIISHNKSLAIENEGQSVQGKYPADVTDGPRSEEPRRQGGGGFERDELKKVPPPGSDVRQSLSAGPIVTDRSSPVNSQKSAKVVETGEDSLEKRKSTAALPQQRILEGPFVVEVVKGFTSLGLTAGEDEMGSVAVKSISRGPISKNGNLKVGDWLLSINGGTLSSAAEANKLLKSLPRGPVHIVAMVPPRNITNIVSSLPSVPEVTPPPVAKVTAPPVAKVTAPPVAKVTPPPVPKATPPPVPEVTPPPVPEVTPPPVPEVTPPPVAKVTPPPVPKATPPPVPEVTPPPVPEATPPPVPEVTPPPVAKVTPPPVPKATPPPVPEVTPPPVPEVTPPPVPEVTPPPVPEVIKLESTNEGIIEVEITCNGQPLGIMVVGGCDMPQQYVSIHSIVPGSPADTCRALQPGDQLVMCGAECLMGLSWKEAQGIVNTVPEKFTIVAQRKASPSITEQQQQQQQQQQQRQQQQLKTGDREKKLANRMSVASEDSFISCNTVESSTNLTDNNRLLVEDKEPPISAPLQDMSASFASRDGSGVFGSPSRYHSSFESSLNDCRDDYDMTNHTVEEIAMGLARIDEEVYELELQKQEGKKLGFVIAGGDKITPDIYVKRIIPDSIASADGRLKVGDRVMFMNDAKIIGLSKQAATDVLRSADKVKLIIARRPLVTGSALNTPLESAVASKQGSPTRSRHPSESPSNTRTRHESSGTIRRRHRRSDSVVSIPSVSKNKISDSVSSLHSINEDMESPMNRNSQTLPRDVGSRLGVKMVELVKGSTGLGMKIIGGKDQPKPFVVRDVFPGGPAAKSSSIFPNDQILEVNGKSFADLTHREAIKYLQSIPLGKVRVLLRSAEYVKVS